MNGGWSQQAYVKAPKPARTRDSVAARGARRLCDVLVRAPSGRKAVGPASTHPRTAVHRGGAPTCSSGSHGRVVAARVRKLPTPRTTIRPTVELSRRETCRVRLTRTASHGMVESSQQHRVNRGAASICMSAVRPMIRGTWPEISRFASRVTRYAPHRLHVRKRSSGGAPSADARSPGFSRRPQHREPTFPGPSGGVRMFKPRGGPRRDLARSTARHGYAPREDSPGTIAELAAPRELHSRSDSGGFCTLGQ